MLQSGLNALSLAAVGNHSEVVKALVGEFGLSMTHRDNVSYTSMCHSYSIQGCIIYVHIHYGLNGSGTYVLFTLNPSSLPLDEQLRHLISELQCT